MPSPLETLGQSLFAVRAFPVRTALTIVAVAVGVFAIVTSVTSVAVVGDYFTRSFGFLDQDVLTVRRLPALAQVSEELARRPALRYSEAQDLRLRLAGDASVGAEATFEVAALATEDEQTDPNVIVIGADEHFADHGNWALTGRGLAESDVALARPVILLGADVAEALFPYADPLGKTVRLRGRRFLVVGVLEQRGSMLGFSQDGLVVAPLPTLYSLYGWPRDVVSAISVRATDGAVPDLADDVAQHLRSARRLLPETDDTFTVELNRDAVESVSVFMGMVSLAGALLGSISLFAAGIGVMNIMLVSVKERTREIGLRKAIGARRRDILLQFLLEALLLCEIGAVLGIVAGVGAGNLTAWYFGIAPSLPLGWMAGSVAAVFAVGLVFGVGPAFQAASLTPLDALRYE